MKDHNNEDTLLLTGFEAFGEIARKPDGYRVAGQPVTLRGAPKAIS